MLSTWMSEDASIKKKSRKRSTLVYFLNDQLR